MFRRGDDFWNPIIMDDDGFYITKGQLDYYLLRGNGFKSIMKYFKNTIDSKYSRDFGEYVETCKIYNVIRDITKDDPTASKMYWDTDDQAIKFTYPEGEAIDMVIRSMIGYEDDS